MYLQLLSPKGRGKPSSTVARAGSKEKNGDRLDVCSGIVRIRSLKKEKSLFFYFTCAVAFLLCLLTSLIAGYFLRVDDSHGSEGGTFAD